VRLIFKCAGTWDYSGAAGLAKGVDCGGAKDSAVTHVNNDVKPSVSLIWKPPAGFSGGVIFVATVVQEFKTYWVGVQSQKLELSANGDETSRLVATAEGSGGNINTSSPSSSTTTVVPSDGGIRPLVPSSGNHSFPSSAIIPSANAFVAFCLASLLVIAF